jgi:hypothetical protein
MSGLPSSRMAEGSSIAHCREAAAAREAEENGFNNQTGVSNISLHVGWRPTSMRSALRGQIEGAPNRIGRIRSFERPCSEPDSSSHRVGLVLACKGNRAPK